MRPVGSDNDILIKILILVLSIVVFTFSGCVQEEKPITPPIVGTWEGPLDYNTIVLNHQGTFRFTFYPDHNFNATTLTGHEIHFSGSWKQCSIDTECPEPVAFGASAIKYNSNAYLLQFNFTYNDDQPLQATWQDLVSVNGDTLRYANFGTLQRA